LKSGFIDLIDKAGKHRGDKFRHQLYIFTVCLLISVFIWSLVRLSRDYFYTVNYRIHYSNLPSSLRMTGFSDSVLTVSIKIQGFDYFTEEFIHPRNPKYTVSLRKIKLYTEDGKIFGYLPTSEIGRDIKSQMNFQTEVYMIFPDTLYFDLERVAAKKIQRIPARPASLTEQKHDSIKINKIK